MSFKIWALLSLETGLKLLHLSHYWRMCVSVFHNGVISLLWTQTTVKTFSNSNGQMKNSQCHWLFTDVVINMLSNLAWGLDQKINDWHLTLLYQSPFSCCGFQQRSRQRLFSMPRSIWLYSDTLLSLRCSFPGSFSRFCVRGKLHELALLQFPPLFSVFSPSWLCYIKLFLPLSLHHSVSCILSQKSCIFLHNDYCNSFIGLEMWLEDIKVNYMSFSCSIS